MSATATNPDGLYTTEEMQAGFPYCPVCECETIPLRSGTCAFCDTQIAPKREEAEQRKHEAERNRVYKLSHKDQINKRRRELRRERQDHVRRYSRSSDALPDDSSLNTAQVMPSGEVTEGEQRTRREASEMRLSVRPTPRSSTESEQAGASFPPPSVTSSLCATRLEPPYPTGAVRAGLVETTHGEIAELAPAPQLSTEVV